MVKYFQFGCINFPRLRLNRKKSDPLSKSAHKKINSIMLDVAVLNECFYGAFDKSVHTPKKRQSNKVLP